MVYRCWDPSSLAIQAEGRVEQDSSAAAEQTHDLQGESIGFAQSPCSCSTGGRWSDRGFLSKELEAHSGQRHHPKAELSAAAAATEVFPIARCQ